MTHFTWKFLLCLAGITATCLAALCPLEAQQLNIHLAFDVEVDQILPHVGLSTSYVEEDLELNPDGKISGIGVTYKVKPYTSSIVRQVNLKNKLGASSMSEWKVVDKDKLINIVDFGGFRRAILLTVSGSTCTAQVDYELKPGFSDFEVIRKDRPRSVNRSITARRLACSVS
jgi:hypothetical protein